MIILTDAPVTRAAPTLVIRVVTTCGILGGCAVNGELFIAYIEQQVVPSLARGDVLIMDNVPVHKAAGVRHALEAAGITLLFLPAYSPDLNPIEMVFAKTKALLRKAAIRAVDALWRALGKISQSLTREECVNYFRHCGYTQSG